MKITTRILIGCTAVAIGLSGGTFHAAAFESGTQLMVSAAGVGQSGSSATPGKTNRQYADDLLRRARQLMAEGDLTAAESLVDQVDALGVTYSRFALVGDTPKKVRAAIDKKKKAAAKAPGLPSQKFSPASLFGSQPKQPATNPFAGRSTGESINSLTDRKSIAASHLQNGRTALQRGNLTAASHYYRMASREPVAFSTGEYSPVQLAAGIRAAGGTVAEATAGFGQPNSSYPTRPPVAPPAMPIKPMEPYGFATAGSGIAKSAPLLPPTNPNAGIPAGLFGRAGTSPAGIASAGDSASSNTLRDARRALAEDDLDRAARLVQIAKKEQRRYGVLDDTPDRVEAAIAQHQALAREMPGSEAHRRGQADLLMEQSQALFYHNDFDRAEQLAREATRQGVLFPAFKMKPEELLSRIAAKRRQMGATPARTAPGRAVASSQSPMASMGAIREAASLTRQARQALNNGQLDLAESLAERAKRLQVPNSTYGPGIDRPGLVSLDIDRARLGSSQGVIPAGATSVVTAAGRGAFNHQAKAAVYDPSNDPTRNRQAQYQSPTAAPPSPPPVPQPLNFNSTATSPMPSPPPTAGSPSGGQGAVFFQQGVAALLQHKEAEANELFRQAAPYMNSLDPTSQQRLRTYLSVLGSKTPESVPPPHGGQPVGVPLATGETLARQISIDVAQQVTLAQRMREADPKGALAMLEEMRQKVQAANLQAVDRQQLLARLDRSIRQTTLYIEQNQPRITLEENNARTRSEIDRDRRVKIEIEENLALMVDEFNRLLDEERWEEAEVVAKRAFEIAPDEPVVRTMKWMAKFVARDAYQIDIRDRKESGFVNVMGEVDKASIPFPSDNPYTFGNLEDFRRLGIRRRRYSENQTNQTPEELEIRQKLKTRVSVQFQGAPLSTVMEYLGQQAGVNTYLDPLALEELGLESSTPVTIELQSEIMLKSALNIILERFHLGYVIKDEVLMITSEHQCQGETKIQTYNVADLVMGIPNFDPGPMGLSLALTQALGSVGYGGSRSFSAGGMPMATLADGSGTGSSVAVNPGLMAQVSQPGLGGIPRGIPLGAGPGGLGGGSQADFDSLIELIQTTINPGSWDVIGGDGSIAPFETNLSLVVSNTQDVHEDIVDLLEQLRRLQDLQVTIEVRFITLNDNFFERIGVDFDFDIDDNIDRPFQVFGRRIAGDDGDPATGTEPGRNTLDVDFDRSVTVGMQQPGVFSADLDIPFTQGSFGLAIPQFGGFDAAAGAQLGFAILSDIEAFFFINAAQGDRRSNVMQAPKVTLFNGQQAMVSDQSQSPFVMSVVPVVGEFAAAQQPVIVVLSEGTMMTVHAVVSPDRRYVRLTVVPFFSKIGKVDTFQFTGSRTSTTNTSAAGIQDDPTDASSNSAASSVTQSGTTVQLPTFSFVTVTTTVSVPDGGTVLLGGIKRLSEGRNEFGVPMLNKIPYLKRLFKNVAIGRETQSLMMMVTPRIIIQEEEELAIGATLAP